MRDTPAPIAARFVLVTMRAFVEALIDCVERGEAHGGGHLEVQGMQQGLCGWSLHLRYTFGCDGPLDDQEVEGGGGVVIVIEDLARGDFISWPTASADRN